MKEARLVALLTVDAYPQSSELADRARGALLGLAAGNLLGLDVEGWSRSAIAERYPDGIRDIDERELGRPWDDDLAQAAILAECMLEDGSLRVEALAPRLVRWLEENGRGCGLLTADVISELTRGTPDAATVVWERSGRRSAGNGAVMRCAPVALRYLRDPHALIEQGIESARVTHADPRCLWSTVATVILTRAAVLDAELDMLAFCEGLRDAGAPDSVLNAIAEVEDASELPPLDGPDMGYTLRALQVAVWALRQPDLEAALVELIGAGGDTDTNGAVAGAILGARDGAGAIPERWLACIPRRAELEELAERLVVAGEQR